jgi:hypothetical protein
MKNPRILAICISFIILAALIASGLLFAFRTTRPMILQHGAPEAAGGRAFAIMNPFRNRRPEEVAEELLSDLHTSRCEQILHDLHSDDPRICTLMKENGIARLIWRQDGSSTRVLVYDLPPSKSRLWITSSRDPEIGFVVSGVSLIQ